MFTYDRMITYIMFTHDRMITYIMFTKTADACLKHLATYLKYVAASFNAWSHV